MAKLIPLADYVNIRGRVIAPSASETAINTLVLSKSPLLPIDEAKQFFNATDVIAFFGVGSDEANFAETYFAGFSIATKSPDYILFYREPDILEQPTPSIGTLTFSPFLTTVFDSVDIENHSFLINGNPVAIQIDTVVAAAIVAPATTATIEQIVAQLNLLPQVIAAGATFAVKNLVAGANPQLSLSAPRTIGAASPFVVPNYITADLSPTGFFNTALRQGVYSQKDFDAPSIFPAVDSEFAFNMYTPIFEPTLDEFKRFSEFAGSSIANDRFFYVQADKSPAYAFQAWAESANIGNTMLVKDSLQTVAFVMGWAASIDFQQLNGKSVAKFKTQTNLLPTVSKSSEKKELNSKKINFVAKTAIPEPLFDDGSVYGKFQWIDEWVTFVFFASKMEKSLINLMIQLQSLPYTDESYYPKIGVVILGDIQEMKNFGGIVSGVNLDAVERITVKSQVGVDVSSEINLEGYYILIKDPAPSVRLERGSPIIKVFYTSGGSIQKIDLSSILVV